MNAYENDPALLVTIRRLLQAVDYQTGVYSDVRIRDLWTAAKALAELESYLKNIKMEVLDESH